MRLLPTFLLLFSLASHPIYQTPTIGCMVGCANELSIEEQYHRADAVFLGVIESSYKPAEDIPFYGDFEEAYLKLDEVINLPPLTPAGYPVYTVFNIVTSWKGIENTTMTIQTGKTACSHPWLTDDVSGRMLLVFAVEDSGELRTHCGLIFEVADKEKLGKYSFAGSPVALKEPWLRKAGLYGLMAVLIVSGIMVRSLRVRRGTNKGDGE